MKTIRIAIPSGRPLGRAWVQPVLVNWFPPLTEGQILMNALYRSNGYPAPFVDPNLIDVEVEIGIEDQTKGEPAEWFPRVTRRPGI